MKTNTLNLENYGVQKMSEKEVKKNEGGLFGIFCIGGVLDGIKHNTRFYWGRCR